MYVCLLCVVSDIVIGMRTPACFAFWRTLLSMLQREQYVGSKKRHGHRCVNEVCGIYMCLLCVVSNIVIGVRTPACFAFHKTLLSLLQRVSLGVFSNAA